MVTQTEEQAKLAQRIDDLVMEADFHQARFRETMTDNFNLFLDGHKGDWTEKDGLRRAIINQIQPSILATISVMTSKPSTVKFTPIETGDKSVYFITEEGYNKLLEAASSPDGGHLVELVQQIQPLTAIDGAMGEQLVQLSQRMIDPMTGSVTESVLDSDDVIAMNDRSCAEWMEQGVRILLDQANAEYYIWENIYNTAILGFQPLMPQWNPDSNLLEIYNPHPSNVRIDPTQTTIERAGYFIIEEVIPASEAKAKMPQYAEVIDEVKSEGVIEEDQYFQLGNVYQNTDFKREMVRIRTAWIRWEPYPMSEQEALDAGKVELEVATRPVEVIDPMTGMPAIDPETGVAVTQEEEYETGGFVLAESGRPVKPDSKAWPTRAGVRQVTKIGQYVVDDRESPYSIANRSEIAACWNRNIPIPGGPFGQGEPERLDCLQGVINRCADIIQRHLHYNQHPERLLPESIREQMKNVDDLNSRAGRLWFIKDSLLAVLKGATGLTFPVSPLAPNVVDVMDLFIREIKNVSGNVDALQGQASYAGQSGEAIKALQTAAQGPVAVRSRHTEFLIRRLNLIVADILLNFVPETQWVKMFSKHSHLIALAFRDRIKTMQFDVRVELPSGSGLNTELERQEARENASAGFISLETAREKMGVDASQERERIARERTEMQGAGGASMA